MGPGHRAVVSCGRGGGARQRQPAHRPALLGGATAPAGRPRCSGAAAAPAGGVNRGAARWDLQRQVRFVAGSIVALSILASIVVPGLKWIAFVMGAGLSITAVTNTCLMGMALAKLPYNRGPACDGASVVAQLAGTGTRS